MALTEKKKKEALAKLRETFSLLGVNTDSDGFRETPERILKLWEMEVTRTVDAHDLDCLTTFPNKDKLSQIVAVTHIAFSSWCEHHILPYMGYVHIGYVPDKKLLGLSKFARIVYHFADRPTIQEELTENIANFIFKKIKPTALIVVVQADHTCMSTRGVRNSTSRTITSALKPNPEAIDKGEFFELVKLNSLGR